MKRKPWRLEIVISSSFKTAACFGESEFSFAAKAFGLLSVYSHKHAPGHLIAPELRNH
jgi:hypothetical protein